ncbi:MAG: HipA domain-containing protein [Bilifractor sp.]
MKYINDQNLGSLCDFSEYPDDNISDYGGSDRKKGIVIDGVPYMLKFSTKQAKPLDISTSYVNNTVSEYLSSHIFQICGIPAHDTLLGVYDGELAVACRNFAPAGSGTVSHEFAWYLRRHYDSSEIGRIPVLKQIYDTIHNDENLVTIEQNAIDRYWDTFIIDALVGNFDRHKGNWSYIYNTETGATSLAPVYDCGSTLFPALNEKGMEEISRTPEELAKRVFQFPTAALALSGQQKIAYYDMMMSGYDENCSNAIKRMVPKINMQKIEEFISEQTFLSDTRKNFYKTIIKCRKKYILSPAYTRAKEKNFSKTSYARLIGGEPIPASKTAWLTRQIESCKDFVLG